MIRTRLPVSCGQVSDGANAWTAGQKFHFARNRAEPVHQAGPARRRFTQLAEI